MNLRICGAFCGFSATVVKICTHSRSNSSICPESTSSVMASFSARMVWSISWPLAMTASASPLPERGSSSTGLG